MAAGSGIEPSTLTSPLTADEWKTIRERMEKHVMALKVVMDLGDISGAQWGAAANLGLNLYRRSPAVALGDEAVKNRLIQVSRAFPGTIITVEAPA
ncbi:MAG: hypothetical protein H0X64_04730 [Gemmatimonadaceae bacterium]|nr:hypothetical protein [Gemmatimonadaceae bacterium]